MSTTQAQVQFGAEFVTLMVAAAGLALLVLRSDPHRRRQAPGSRLVAASAFVITGTAAFLHGSLVLSQNPPAVLSVARLVGAVALGLAIPGWSGGRRTGLLLWLGAAAWAIGALIELDGASNWVVDGLLVAGSATVGVALLVGSRHSIASRVAASGAATVLLVVLVLAVALSAVISSSLQRDELGRLSSRARTESAQVGDAVNTAGKDARFVAGDLEGYFHLTNPNPLITYATGGAPAGVGNAAAAIKGRLQSVSNSYRAGGGFAYAGPSGAPLIVAGTIAPALAAELARQPAMARPPCHGPEPGAVFVTGASTWAAAAYPECLSRTAQRLGTVITISPLGQAYLQSRVPVDPAVSLALVTPQAVLAAAGPQPPASTLTALAGRPPGTEARGNRFYAVVPVSVASGSPPLAVVLSSPATTVVSTRNQLYRTLFLIALGGTVLALGLAAFTGDRITAGVRRLTYVATRIQDGNTSDRAYIAGDDEVAVLGSAFDSMIDSVEEQAGALQGAADDETRLRNRLEAVVAGMTDALVAVDAGGLVTDFNRAAAEMLAVDRFTAVGRPVDEVVDLVDETGVSLRERLVDAAAPPWGQLGNLRRGDAAEVPVAVSSGALVGPGGELAGRVLVLRDLRHEREVEQMKTEFLSRVGHELRTPLTGIMGYADILVRREVAADRAREWHDEILQAGRRLLRIVEMLEFFASSGAGRVPLRPETLDTRALVNGLTSSWSARVPSNVSIGRRVARDTPLVVGDRRWLSMAIDELIDNAVKFSPEGGRIVVAAASAPGLQSGRAAGSAVEISVSDEGVGMGPEDHATVFAEFAQADGSDTRRFGGLGLGLAVVRRVVEGHGGEVSCRSVPGRGTTFTMVLPAACPDR